MSASVARAWRIAKVLSWAAIFVAAIFMWHGIYESTVPYPEVETWDKPLLIAGWVVGVLYAGGTVVIGIMVPKVARRAFRWIWHGQ